MTNDPFKYDQLVEEALRGVVSRVLEEAARVGLPGNHHFYITFKTAFPGVEVPKYLAEKYPDEMTIVLQYQFWDLKIFPERFCVTLSFNDIREPLIIPFAAITGFADPSVKFGLQFQVEMEEPVIPAVPALSADAPASGDEAEDEVPATGEVVSLDQFRKKK